MRIDKKKLAICLLIPLVGGAISGWISRGGMETFQQLNQPPLSPPGWLFPIVWTILYLMMGLASYLVSTSEEAFPADKNSALTVYGLQLAMNFVWPIIFFSLEMRLLGFFWLVHIWLLVLLCIRLFKDISPTAAKLMIPYLLWLTFAGYLNLFVYLLNK